jgi:hypothetical protein
LWVDNVESVKIAWSQIFNFDKRDLISYSTIKIILKKHYLSNHIEARHKLTNYYANQTTSLTSCN